MKKDLICKNKNRDHGITKLLDPYYCKPISHNNNKKMHTMKILRCVTLDGKCIVCIKNGRPEPTIYTTECTVDSFTHIYDYDDEEYCSINDWAYVNDQYNNVLAISRTEYA